MSAITAAIAAYIIIGTGLLFAFMYVARDQSEEHLLGDWKFRLIVIGACIVWPLTLIWGVSGGDK